MDALRPGSQHHLRPQIGTLDRLCRAGAYVDGSGKRVGNKQHEIQKSNRLACC